MAQGKDSTNLTKLLWECLGASDPMLHMLEWLCDQLMDAKRNNLDCGTISSKIDQMVYSLYGLNQLEVNYLESNK
jgi:hypothetical protein